MTRRPDLRRFLEFESVAWPATPAEGYAYRSPHEYLLRNGREYVSAPLTSEEAAYLDRLVTGLDPELPAKACYANAQRLVLDSMGRAGPVEVRYVEGLAATDIVPAFDHGWLTLNGKVVDPTLRFLPGERGTEQACLPGRAAGLLPAGRAYFGVEFEAHQVMRHASDYKELGSMLSDWWNGCPLLKLPPGEKQRRRGRAAGGPGRGGPGL